jgi:tetratricopeptide (TPR) repeat protein
VGTFEGRIFVAMEYLEGEDLQSWCEREGGRPWEEVLSAYIKAGRGLEAAHRAGLVHRDFKPENAFRCEDGRVKVLDFGLAFLAQPDLLSTHSEEDEAEFSADEVVTATTATLNSERSSSHSLSMRMTKPGAVLGTPAFMAPEQWDGAETDARSDQFSFCAALYEGVYAQRPFRGETIPSLAFNIKRGEVSEAPANSKVPTWLRRVLLRGLERDPDKRWPSMGALLAELERDRTAPRRRMLAAAAALGLVLGGWWWSSNQDANRLAACQGSDGRLAELWSRAQRDEVRRSIEATGLSYAADTAARVEKGIDDYAGEWIAGHREACEATRVRGEQSSNAMDLRMACLERRRSELSALIGVFEKADKEVVEKASNAVDALSSLEACADVEALLSGVPAPADAETATRVEEIRGELSRALALQKAGKYEEGLDVSALALEASKSLGYEPLRAEALTTRGNLLHLSGQYEAAETDLTEAVWLATAHKHDQYVLLAASALLQVVGFEKAKTDEGLIWWRYAQAVLTRVGGDPPREAQLNNAIGNLYLAKQDFAKAREYYLESLRIRETLPSWKASSRAKLFLNLGTASLELGENDTGQEYFEQALGVLRVTDGPRHPSTAKAHNNLGIALERAKDYDGAIRHQNAALDIKKEIFGAEHPSIAGSLGNLANVRALMGDYEGSRDLYLEALRIFEKALGPKHHYVGRCHNGIAEAERRLENWDAALASLARAIAIFEASPNTARNLAGSKFKVAQTLRGAGREPERANRLASEALEYFLNRAPEQAELIARIEGWLAGEGESP